MYLGKNEQGGQLNCSKVWGLMSQIASSLIYCLKILLLKYCKYTNGYFITLCYCSAFSICVHFDKRPLIKSIWIENYEKAWNLQRCACNQKVCTQIF